MDRKKQAKESDRLIKPPFSRMRMNSAMAKHYRFLHGGKGLWIHKREHF